MKTRIVAVALTRSLTILHRWLRFTWLGRPSLFVFRRRHEVTSCPWRRTGKPPTIFRPSLEYRKSRPPRDNILSAASAPRSVGGKVVLACDNPAALNNIAARPAATNPVRSASIAAFPRNPDSSQKECYP